MNKWIRDLKDLCAADDASVLVTVAGIRGSAPREIGARMIVTSRETLGTIGGGELEYQCTRLAAGMLGRAEASRRRFPLGSSMGQCCGGVVEILFEPLADGIPAWLNELDALHCRREAAVIVTQMAEPPHSKVVVTAAAVHGCDAQALPGEFLSAARAMLAGARQACRIGAVLYEPVVLPDLNIAVFGAGHVGTAVVQVLSSLDCTVRWIDSRRGMFPRVPDNVLTIETAEPALEVAAMPAQSFYLVMTHSHAIDFEICDHILRRNDARYCGLIGSLSKRRRFEKRFRQQGMCQAMVDTLVCPIGVDGISGKKPAEIAVAAAAEILKIRERAADTAVPGYAGNVHSL
ncbi:MAG: xanthine dehydrogenase accessory protein XdhC [Woeseiaceae bacterium]|nr:xanthine dehydrogenase accessory protein XdhC [Woeseiaceae bacterium]